MVKSKFASDAMLAQCLANFNFIDSDYNDDFYSLFPSAGFHSSCRTQMFFLYIVPVCHRKKNTLKNQSDCLTGYPYSLGQTFSSEFSEKDVGSFTQEVPY